MAAVLPRQDVSKDPMPQEWMHLSGCLGYIESCGARGNSPPRQHMAGIRRNRFQRKWMRKGQPPRALEIVVGALVGIHHDQDGWRRLSVLFGILGRGCRWQSLRLSSSAFGNFNSSHTNIVRVDEACRVVLPVIQGRQIVGSASQEEISRARADSTEFNQHPRENYVSEAGSARATKKTSSCG